MTNDINRAPNACRLELIGIKLAVEGFPFGGGIAQLDAMLRHPSYCECFKDGRAIRLILLPLFRNLHNFMLVSGNSVRQRANNFEECLRYMNITFIVNLREKASGN